MKVLGTLVLAVIMVTGLVGCSKTLTELRANGDAVIDTGVNTGVGILTTVGEVAKKLVSVGFAAYDVVKSIVADSKDNVGTVVNTVTGADQTPVAPATK